MKKMLKCDVLVIGGGIAACFAAIKAAQAGASVVMADKGFVGKSGQSPYADGFMIFNPDWGHDMEVSMEELNRHSEYLNNRYWTQKTMEDSYARYLDLVEWGCVFEKKADGTLATRGKPGAKTPTAAQFDKTDGHYGKHLRRQALKEGVTILDHLMIVELLKENGRIVGGVGLPRESAELVTIIAKNTISCVGACGYKPDGYPPLMQLTGDGEAMAYRAGAAIVGKEFVDAHYTKNGWADPVGQRGSMPPPPPGAGNGPPPGGDPRIRTNVHGEVISNRPEGTSPYMFTYLQSEFAVHDGQGPIASRGAVSIGGAALGMSLRKADGLWPADNCCRSTVPGLFAAGDALGNMQNGAAYSLGGGSICGGAVTGTIAAEEAAREAAGMEMPEVPREELERAHAFVLGPLERVGGYGAHWALEVLRGFMMPYFVYFVKKADRLEAALTLVRYLGEHIAPAIYARDAHELRLAHEVKNMILSAEMRLRSALFRTESRGNHYREDYPDRDDGNWLCWTKIQGRDGDMVLEKVPVPEEWRPDETASYRKKYPYPFPGEKEV